ncbi:MAG: nitrogen fixation protein NifW [Gammaproteobacteria bacterium 28-57-27]|nr:MAG: nitrogen fixation protein NifW [Gammaproteobacteria bacterium 28-57-27]
MTESELDDLLEDLSSAEEFLVFFDIDYDERVVHVNRLHILQRFHNYLEQGLAAMPEGGEARFMAHRELLLRAYQDFVDSDALTEKVFKVFHMHEPQTTFVPFSL